MASVLVVMLFNMAGYAHGRSGSPVTQACNSMTPHHIFSWTQKGPAPYAIDLAPQKDGSYYVTVYGMYGKQYKGFLVQARSRGRRVGVFTDVQKTGRLINCTYHGGAVQHRNSKEKSKVMTLWEPNGFTGRVKFRAAVVENYFVYWNNIFSDPIYIY